MSRDRIVVGVLWLVLGGCVPTEFEDLRSESSTVSLAPPGDYPVLGFGEVVVGYDGVFGETFVSRIAASAGVASPYTVFPLVIGEEVRLDTPILDGCTEGAPCQRGAGLSLAGMPSWGDRTMCVAAASPESGEIKVRCEDDATQTETVAGPTNQAFGTSAVGLRLPWARALFGAPRAVGGRGAVYRLADRAAPVELDLSEAFGAADEFGVSLVAAALSDDRLIFATSAPGRDNKRVVVATSTRAGDGTVTTRVHACLDAITDGYGGALALGDFDGDGALDLAVGSRGDPERRRDAVEIYDGAALPPEGSCAGAWSPAVTLECAEREGVPCDRAHLFGAALAAGDLDGDGRDELVIGAPRASVGGVLGAGVAYVYRGADGLTNLTDTTSLLRHSTPTEDANLGTALAASASIEIEGRRRAEIAAGAPGAHRVYVFLCSGIEGDLPSDALTNRCQPR